MENTTGKWEFKTPSQFFSRTKEKPESDWATNWVPFTASGKYVIADRPQKRAKPKLLLPRNGTPSSIREYRVQTIDEGLYEKISWNRPVGRPWYPTITQTQYPFTRSLVAESERILSQSYSYYASMVKRLDNKAIEKIMDGSGQLANDLLELNKTKRMVSAAVQGLIQGWKDLKGGRPMSQLVKALKKEGWNGLAGRKFLEFIYGWSPTVEGAFETADTLNQSWYEGKYYIDRVSATETGEIHMLSGDNYWNLNGGFTVRGKAQYQFRISNPKMALFKHLGLTNPASIVWEATPYSFVFDWAFRFGSHVQNLDWDLGKSDIWIQHSITRDHTVVATPTKNNGILGAAYTQLEQSSSTLRVREHSRGTPKDRIVPTWKGVRNPYSSENAGTRLAVSLALLDQQRMRMRKF